MYEVLFFIVGVLFGALLGFYVSFHSLKEYYSNLLESKLRRIWKDAWKFCLWECLGAEDWNDEIEKYSIRSSRNTFDKWRETLDIDLLTKEESNVDN
jgi:hypothetical protein